MGDFRGSVDENGKIVKNQYICIKPQLTYNGIVSPSFKWGDHRLDKNRFFPSFFKTKWIPFFSSMTERNEEGGTSCYANLCTERDIVLFDSHKIEPL